MTQIKKYTLEYVNVQPKLIYSHQVDFETHLHLAVFKVFPLTQVGIGQHGLNLPAIVLAVRILTVRNSWIEWKRISLPITTSNRKATENSFIVKNEND